MDKNYELLHTVAAVAELSVSQRLLDPERDGLTAGGCGPERLLAAAAWQQQHQRICT